MEFELTQKTQLLCISDCKYSNVVSYINNQDGTRTNSEDRMKILGFVFGKKPNVSEHVDYVITKYYRAVWSISHIKKSKIPVQTIVNVYCVMLRPIIEFCHVVYHPMLSEEQSEKIEKLQRQH